jgi:glycine cleavage system H protein
MARPQDLRYASTHEWVRVDGRIATVGITDHAVHELSDLVFIDLPKKGRELRREEVFGEIESTKTVADLYAPVSGKVVEVHAEVADDLDLIKSSPFGDGWLIRIEMSNPGEIDKLLSAAAYDQSLKSEEH